MPIRVQGVEALLSFNPVAEVLTQGGRDLGFRSPFIQRVHEFVFLTSQRSVLLGTDSSPLFEAGSLYSLGKTNGIISALFGAGARAKARTYEASVIGLHPSQ